MSRKEAEFPQAKRNAPMKPKGSGWRPTAGLAPVMRSSITAWKHRSPIIQIISNAIRTGNLLGRIRMFHLVSVLPTVLATSSS